MSHTLTHVGRSFHGICGSYGSNTKATPSWVSPVAMSFLQKKNPPKRTNEIYKILLITKHKYNKQAKCYMGLLKHQYQILKPL